jgi:AraC-like DNA-binding protein
MHPASKPITGQIPSSYVQLLHDYLAQQARFTSSLDASPPREQAWYTVEQWRAMLESASLALDDPLLGLHVGASITPAHLGPLGYVLMASSSAEAALERYLRFQRLIHDVSPVSRRADADGLQLEWSNDSRHVGLLVNQCGMAALVAFACHITGSDVRPLSLSFVEPTPDNADDYADFFGCPVLFEQSATRIDFPLALLHHPLRQTDPTLVQLLERQAEQALAGLSSGPPWLDALRGEITQGLTRGQTDLAALARTFGLSERTLRRRLYEHDLNFRQLLKQVRQQLALRYLADRSLTVADIALLLGYAEHSAFTRAFRRWQGCSPAHWQARQGN